MSYTFYEIYEGINDAERSIKEADRNIDRMARLISGKLKSGKVSRDVLYELKKELKNYNMHTNSWKE